MKGLNSSSAKRVLGGSRRKLKIKKKRKSVKVTIKVKGTPKQAIKAVKQLASKTEDAAETLRQME